MRPIRGRNGHKEREPHALGEFVAKRRHVAGGCHARQQRQRYGPQRHSEDTQRQLHETEGNRQPERRAIAQLGGEDGVDEHVHLSRARGNHRWPHQLQNGLDAWIAPTQIVPVTISGASQRRQLHAQLQRTTYQRADRRAEQRPGTEAGVEVPPEQYTAHDRAEIEEAGGHRRDTEHIPRVQHAHDQGGQRYQQDEGIHHPGQGDGEFGLVAGEPRRQHVHEPGREEDADHRKGAEYDGG